MNTDTFKSEENMEIIPTIDYHYPVPAVEPGRAMTRTWTIVLACALAVLLLVLLGKYVWSRADEDYAPERPAPGPSR